MVRLVKVAATQMAISRDPAANLVGGATIAADLWVICMPFNCIYVDPQAKAEKMVRQAAAAGAQVILLQVRALQAHGAAATACSGLLGKPAACRASDICSHGQQNTWCLIEAMHWQPEAPLNPRRRDRTRRRGGGGSAPRQGATAVPTGLLSALPPPRMLQELFENVYFCQEQDPVRRAAAHTRHAQGKSPRHASTCRGECSPVACGPPARHRCHQASLSRLRALCCSSSRSRGRELL